MCLGFYTLVIVVLGTSKQALAAFSDPRGALKMVFGVCSISDVQYTDFIIDTVII